MRSITASRILHLPSSTRSSITGKRDCVSSSAPMTLLSKDSDDMMLSCTLEVESNRKCVIVASFPSSGCRRPTHAPRLIVDGRDYQRQDALDDSVYPNEGILSFLPQHWLKPCAQRSRRCHSPRSTQATSSRKIAHSILTFS